MWSRRFTSLVVPIVMLLGTSLSPNAVEAAGEKSACELFRVAEIRPKNAGRIKYSGVEARVFLESVLDPLDEADPSLYDSVYTGETTVFIARSDCVVGYKFLSPLANIHATEMVRLVRSHPDVAPAGVLDQSRVSVMATEGSAAAQFHVGYVAGKQTEAVTSRADAIAWFRRSAEQGFEPAWLALGLALVGPGRLTDQAIEVGAAPAQDELTDLVQACYWLKKAVKSRDKMISSVAQLELAFTDLESMLSSDQRRECRALLKQWR